MLRPQINKYKKLYQEHYKSIRNKIFAHSDKQGTLAHQAVLESLLCRSTVLVDDSYP